MFSSEKVKPAAAAMHMMGRWCAALAAMHASVMRCACWPLAAEACTEVPSMPVECIIPTCILHAHASQCLLSMPQGPELQTNGCAGVARAWTCAAECAADPHNCIFNWGMLLLIQRCTFRRTQPASCRLVTSQHLQQPLLPFCGPTHA